MIEVTKCRGGTFSTYKDWFVSDKRIRLWWDATVKKKKESSSPLAVGGWVGGCWWWQERRSQLMISSRVLFPGWLAVCLFVYSTCHASSEWVVGWLRERVRMRVGRTDTPSKDKDTLSGDWAAAEERITQLEARNYINVIIVSVDGPLNIVWDCVSEPNWRKSCD